MAPNPCRFCKLAGSLDSGMGWGGRSRMSQTTCNGPNMEKTKGQKSVRLRLCILTYPSDHLCSLEIHLTAIYQHARYGTLPFKYPCRNLLTVSTSSNLPTCRSTRISWTPHLKMLAYLLLMEEILHHLKSIKYCK